MNNEPAPNWIRVERPPILVQRIRFRERDYGNELHAQAEWFDLVRSVSCVESYSVPIPHNGERRLPFGALLAAIDADLHRYLNAIPFEACPAEGSCVHVDWSRVLTRTLTFQRFAPRPLDAPAIVAAGVVVSAATHLYGCPCPYCTRSAMRTANIETVRASEIDTEIMACSGMGRLEDAAPTGAADVDLAPAGHHYPGAIPLGRSDAELMTATIQEPEPTEKAEDLSWAEQNRRINALLMKRPPSR